MRRLLGLRPALAEQADELGVTPLMFAASGLSLGLGFIVPPQYMEYEVYGDLIMIYLKPYSIYLRGSIGFRVRLLHAEGLSKLNQQFLATRSFPGGSPGTCEVLLEAKVGGGSGVDACLTSPESRHLADATVQHEI